MRSALTLGEAHRASLATSYCDRGHAWSAIRRWPNPQANGVTPVSQGIGTPLLSLYQGQRPLTVD